MCLISDLYVHTSIFLIFYLFFACHFVSQLFVCCFADLVLSSFLLAPEDVIFSFGTYFL